MAEKPAYEMQAELKYPLSMNDRWQELPPHAERAINRLYEAGGTLPGSKHLREGIV